MWNITTKALLHLGVILVVDVFFHYLYILTIPSDMKLVTKLSDWCLGETITNTQCMFLLQHVSSIKNHIWYLLCQCHFIYIAHKTTKADQSALKLSSIKMKTNKRTRKCILCHLGNTRMLTIKYTIPRKISFWLSDTAWIKHQWKKVLSKSLISLYMIDKLFHSFNESQFL